MFVCVCVCVCYEFCARVLWRRVEFSCVTCCRARFSFACVYERECVYMYVCACTFMCVCLCVFVLRACLVEESRIFVRHLLQGWL